MPGAPNRSGLAGVLSLGLLLTAGLALRSVAQSSGPLSMAADRGPTITNLAQLTHALTSEERLYRSVRLQGVVCASSAPRKGVVVLQDPTGVELLELGRRAKEIRPGEIIRIEGDRLLLRRRDLGTQICAAPVVDNDGLHGWKYQTNEVVLKAGRVPLEVDWFNCLRSFGLEVYCQSSHGPRQLAIGSTGNYRWGSANASALWRAPSKLDGETNLAPGLQVECYEGFWEKVPDFDLLRPVKTGATTNLDLQFRTRDELVALRFTGFFEVPSDGNYTFRLASDDGSLLFLGDPQVPLRRVGADQAPAPQPALIGEPMSEVEERRWLSVQGRVSFISRLGEGLELELRSGADTLFVEVVDASGLDPTALLNAGVRAVGVGRAALSASQRVVLDRLLVPDARGLARDEAEMAGTSLPLVSISQVQTMRLENAQRQLPVRIRGVVTASSRPDHWMSLR